MLYNVIQCNTYVIQCYTVLYNVIHTCVIQRQTYATLLHSVIQQYTYVIHYYTVFCNVIHMLYSVIQLYYVIHIHTIIQCFTTL